MALPPYTADVDNVDTPDENVSGGYAAREIRAVKVRLAEHAVADTALGDRVTAAESTANAAEDTANDAATLAQQGVDDAATAQTAADAATATANGAASSATAAQTAATDAATQADTAAAAAADAQAAAELAAASVDLSGVEADIAVNSVAITGLATNQAQQQSNISDLTEAMTRVQVINGDLTGALYAWPDNWAIAKDLNNVYTLTHGVGIVQVVTGHAVLAATSQVAIFKLLSSTTTEITFQFVNGDNQSVTLFTTISQIFLQFSVRQDYLQV